MRKLTGIEESLDNVFLCYLKGPKYGLGIEPFQITLWPNCSVEVLTEKSPTNAFIRASEKIWGRYSFKKKNYHKKQKVSRILLQTGAYFYWLNQNSGQYKLEESIPLTNLYILNTENIPSELEEVLMLAFKLNWQKEYLEYAYDRLFSIQNIIWVIQRQLKKEGEV